MPGQYPIGIYFEQMRTLVGVDPERVLRRVGLSPALVEDTNLTVTADVYLRIWSAVAAEADRPGMEMELALAYAHGPFLPPVFAFSCAETLALGLQRLADFKPLIGPMTIEVTRSADGLRVDMRPSDPNLVIPPSMGLFEILYITECARCFTGVPVVPVQSTLPGPFVVEPEIAAFLGHTPQVSTVLSLTFASEDADRPLITRSASLWATLEPGLQDQLEARLGTQTMSARIKRTLTEALPGGSTTIDDMAKRLNMSKRSLQRRLNEEGTSFQEVLNETRFEMSDLYLRDDALSVPEISYLLGFRDTSSFFRAFQGWTGMTPGDYRVAKDADAGAHLH